MDTVRVRGHRIRVCVDGDHRNISETAHKAIQPGFHVPAIPRPLRPEDHDHRTAGPLDVLGKCSVTGFHHNQLRVRRNKASAILRFGRNIHRGFHGPLLLILESILEHASSLAGSRLAEPQSRRMR